MTRHTSDVGPFRCVRHEQVGSTNDEALAELRNGDRGGLFVVADRQSGGRGRHGRPWVSPPGNLYASLALRDPAPPPVAAQLGFVAGVALVTALRKKVGRAEGITLKWPNDIVVAGAKLAGILLESTTLLHGALGCVIGFGVNCRSHPDGLAYRATSLREIGALDPSPMAMLDTLSVEVDRQLTIWDRGAGFGSIRASWLEHAAGLGGTISVAMARQTITGTFRDIDMQGRLVVETGEGLVAVTAGDVFLAASSSNAMQEQSETPSSVDD